MMKLYVYDHCPFCVKARMIFGLKDIPFELIILANDDESTPVSLIGQKMVPILQKENGEYMPESMDIVHYLDKRYGPEILTGPVNPQISEWLKTVGVYLNRLLMPRCVKSALGEFAVPSARDYYRKKKEAIIGSFEENLENSAELIKKANSDLLALNNLIQSERACNGELSTDDIHLFPSLRGLSIVKGVNYPAQVEAYRTKMARLAKIKLFDDIAV